VLHGEAIVAYLQAIAPYPTTLQAPDPQSEDVNIVISRLFPLTNVFEEFFPVFPLFRPGKLSTD